VLHTLRLYATGFILSLFLIGKHNKGAID